MSPVPIAFYAPLKAPDHPHPSGDRTMARLLLAALREAGFAPEIASRLRTYEPAGDRARQVAIAAESRAEADRLTALYEGRGAGNFIPRHAEEARNASSRSTHDGCACVETRPVAALRHDAAGGAGPGAVDRPRLWFTYHCYYKAPDHLGPEMARRLGIPLVVAEASRAPKRAGGPWAFAHEAAEAAIDRADALLVLTGRDRAGLAEAARPGQRIVDLPPFVDARAEGARAEGARGAAPEPGGPVRLLAVAMMRPGDKLASYTLLADALARIGHLPWTLDVVGGGAARPEVESRLAPLGGRVAFRGELDGPALAFAYAGADLLVWPAVNEAYGMVLLEAQAHGCPVLAGGYGGVPDALRAGVTGEIAPRGDAAAFADAAARLIRDGARRAAMGAAARRFVAGERSLSHAAVILRDTLRPLVDLPSAA